MPEYQKELLFVHEKSTCIINVTIFHHIITAKEAKMDSFLFNRMNGQVFKHVEVTTIDKYPFF